MKSFVFTRLHERDHDYDYYVPPRYTLGGIKGVIKSDLLDKKTRFLSLECKNGQVSFGIREQLDLRDVRGRLICHFSGYQLDPQEGMDCIPSLAALINQIPAITAEANRVHGILDEDPAQGKNLQTPAIAFGFDPQQDGNDWDQAVQQIQKNPGQDALFLFDEQGKLHPMLARFVPPASPKPAEIAGPVDVEVITQPPKPKARAAAVSKTYDAPQTSFAQQIDGKATKGKAQKKASDEFSGTAGIKSNVTLRPDQRTYVPPLEPPPPRSFIGELFDGFCGLFRRRRQPRKHNNDYNY